MYLGTAPYKREEPYPGWEVDSGLPGPKAWAGEKKTKEVFPQ